MKSENSHSLSRFIPVSKQDLFKSLLNAHNNILDKSQLQQFYRLLDSRIHYEFHTLITDLNDSYSAYDPDSETLKINTDIPAEDFFDNFTTLLEKANYEKISHNDLQKALNTSSLFKIKLYVDLDDFSDQLIYCRGESLREENIPFFMGLFPRKIQFINYERVILCLKLNEDSVDDTKISSANASRSIFIKLFKNVPSADLEMLFPNTRIGMRLQDKLLIGIPALVSGGVVLSTKLGASLVLLGSLIGFWLGISNHPVEINNTAMMALLAGMIALGGYLWKQFNSFKNRKLKFTQALTQNLYFKNLDNNAGVFHRLAHDAEEEECKEALLAYYFLANSQTALSAADLDKLIEQWLHKQWQFELNFDIQDALNKLQRMSLINVSDNRYSAINLKSAIKMLDDDWDAVFST